MMRRVLLILALLAAIAGSGCRHHNLACNGCGPHGGQLGRQGPHGHPRHARQNHPRPQRHAHRGHAHRGVGHPGSGHPGSGIGLANNPGVAPIPRIPHNYQQPGPPGPPTGSFAYPYYTTRGPRDFLHNDPAPLGP